MTRDELHTQIHSHLDAADKQGIIASCTGSGKTKCALSYLVKEQAKKVLWVVPTEKLRDDTLPAEFQKWGQYNHW